MSERYTVSQDGVARATVTLSLRLTREEIAWIRKHGSKDIRSWLSGIVSTELWERQAEQRERAEHGYSDAIEGID